MFNAVLSDGKIWKQIVGAVSPFIADADFVVEPVGLTLRTLDPSKTLMVDMHIPNAVFDEYQCDGRHEISVSMDELAKVAGRIQKNDMVMVDLQEEEKRLQFVLVGRVRRTFMLPLMDSIGEIPKKPKIQYTASIELSKDLLKQAIKDVSIISSFATFEMDEQAFRVRGLGGGDTRDVTVIIERENESAQSFSLADSVLSSKSSSTDTSSGTEKADVEQNKVQVRSRYAITFLSDMIKAISVSDTVRLQFATQKPLQMEFNLAGGGRIAYILAPRIYT